MRKLMVFVLVFQLFIFTNLLSGKAASSSSWLEAEVEYFQEKEYKGNESIYTEVDFYPPYFTQGEADKEDILRYLRLLRNEIFARRGYVFGSEELKEFFKGMKWYKSQAGEVELSEVERSNVLRIQEEEERYKSGEGERERNTGEKYEKKVIIEAKWGSGPGEFGLEPLDETYTWVTYISLDKESNFYIADPNNGRINVFNENGKFVKEISISSELKYSYAGISMTLVEGIGVDDKGNIYLASSSTPELLEEGHGEVILKLNKDGKVLEKYVFKGAYLDIPHFYRDDEGNMYLWGSWKTSSLSSIKALIPLEYGRGKGINLKHGLLSSRSFKNNGNAIKLLNKRIKISGDRVPRTFNISTASRVVYYDACSFIYVFQNEKGEIKEKLDIYPRYYPRGYGFSYKRWKNVSIWSEPYIDKELNIYCIAGTSEELHVIKYIPNKEIWE
ncbi:YARHG domain-containing protein [candidate division WOR-3 bacterium]|nr:YARHG domain-containing protein [candidate division WOR-3 bacterium]